MSNRSVRRSFGVAAALVLLWTAAAAAAPERPEAPSGDLSLTVLLKGNPGGR